MEQLDHTSKASNRNTRMSLSPWAMGSVVLLALGACQKNEPLDQYGCTEMEYDNYDPDANAPNGSCCRFVDAGSRIWRGTVTDSATGIVVPYMVTRIAGWLEGPCIKMDAGAICTVSDNLCGLGDCVNELFYHEPDSYWGYPIHRTVEAYSISNISNCCVDPVLVPDTITYISSSLNVLWYTGGIQVYNDTVNPVYISQDGRYGGTYASQVAHPIPDRGVDSVIVRIINLTIH